MIPQKKNWNIYHMYKPFSENISTVARGEEFQKSFPFAFTTTTRCCWLNSTKNTPHLQTSSKNQKKRENVWDWRSRSLAITLAVIYQLTESDSASSPSSFASLSSTASIASHKMCVMSAVARWETTSLIRKRVNLICRLQLVCFLLVWFLMLIDTFTTHAT